MENTFVVLMVIFGICFILGVVYPVFAILVYPIYKVWGGDMKFGEYVRNL